MKLDNPISHTNDPEPSKVAEKAMNRGKRSTNAVKVFNLVRRNPRSTSSELAALSELGVTEVRRRLTDLKQNGYIAIRGKRTCSVAGTLQSTWDALRDDEPVLKPRKKPPKRHVLEMREVLEALIVLWYYRDDEGAERVLEKYKGYLDDE